MTTRTEAPSLISIASTVGMVGLMLTPVGWLTVAVYVATKVEEDRKRQHQKEATHAAYEEAVERVMRAVRSGNTMEFHRAFSAFTENRRRWGSTVATLLHSWQVQARFLIEAVNANAFPIAESLTSNGARPSTVVDETTAIHTASALPARSRFIRLFCRVDLHAANCQARGNNTPLHVAHREGREANIATLTDCGAEPRQNAAGQLPSDLAPREQ